MTKKNSILIIIFISLFISILIYYFSSNFGRDFLGYIDLIECDSAALCENDYKTELIFSYLNKVLGLFIPAQLVIFSYIFISILIKEFCFYELPNFWFVTLIYLFCFSLLFEGNQIRLAIGLSFALYAIKNLINNKNLNFFLFLLIGSLFHISILILIILFLPIIYPILIFSTLFIFLGNASIFVNLINDNVPFVSLIFRLSNLLNYVDSNNLPTLYNSKNLILIILLIINIKMGLLKNTLNKKILICSILSTFGIYFFPDFFSRISDIFLFIFLVTTSWQIGNRISYKLMIFIISILLLYSNINNTLINF